MSAGKKKSGFRSFMEYIGDSIVPKKFRPGIIGILGRASIRDVPYFDYGVAALVLFFITMGLDLFIVSQRFFMNVPLFLRVPIFAFMFLPIFLILVSISISAYYLLLKSKIAAKIRRMEAVFPEFLEELSLNLKAGQSLVVALGNSTEEEFGDLTYEVQLICKKADLGIDLEVAVREFIESYNSDMLYETFDLILVGWRKGTKVTRIVDRVYENLMLTRHLRNKVIASVSNYRIFLSFVTVLISPAMFALSYHMISLVRNITSKILAVSANVVLPINIQAVRINDSHFIMFSYMALALISISTSMIISIIKTGTVEEGYKQIVVLTTLTMLSYAFFLFMFGKFFLVFAT